MSNTAIIFNAAYTGALSGISSRWLTSAAVAGYPTAIACATAFATAVDDDLGVMTDVTQSQANLLQQICSSFWEGRNPVKTNAEDYVNEAAPLCDLFLASRASLEEVPDILNNPPALLCYVGFKTGLYAFSGSQLLASSTEEPLYQWVGTTGALAGGGECGAIGPDGQLYFPSNTLGGVVRYQFNKNGTTLSPYRLTDLGGVATIDNVAVMAAQAPNSGLDPFTLFHRATGNLLYRWSGSVIRGSTVPGFADPTVFTGYDPVNEHEAILDANGRLWSISTGAGPINRYSGLTGAAGALTKDVSILGSNWPTSHQGAAMNAAGDLFVSNYATGAGSIRVANAALITSLEGAGASNPVPSLIFTSADLKGAEFLAFDYAGNLWAASFDTPQIARFPAAQLTVSGVITADIVLTGGGLLGDGISNGLVGLRFFPGFGPLR